MFDGLFEKIKRVDEIESKILSIFEGKTWEHISLALYQILNDIDLNNTLKENIEAFRNMVMKLQANKNQYLYSPDGCEVRRVSEKKWLVGDEAYLEVEKGKEPKKVEILKIDGTDATVVLSNGTTILTPIGNLIEELYYLWMKDIEESGSSRGIKKVILSKMGQEDWKLYLGKGGRLYMLDRGPHAAGKVVMFNSIADAKKAGWRIVDVVEESKDWMVKRELIKTLPNEEAMYRETWHSGKVIEPVQLSWSLDGDPKKLEFNNPKGEYGYGDEKVDEDITSAHDKEIASEFKTFTSEGMGSDEAVKKISRNLDIPEKEILKSLVISGFMKYHHKSGYTIVGEAINPNRLANWIEEVKQDVKNAIDTGELEDDVYDVLDYLKRNYRADNPAEAYDAMEQAVYDWYKSNIRESINENLTDHARRELEIAGLFDKDSDYNGMLGEAVMELIQKFAEQGHSGFSAELTKQIFDKLASWKPLSELTDSLNEWEKVSDAEFTRGKPLYQSKRSPSCFSEDGGKTYWDIDEDWFYHTDENGIRYSGGLTEEEWSNRPMHTSKHDENGKAKNV